MSTALVCLFIIIAIALVFEFINGFHDSANAISMAISTKALSPRYAVLYAAIFDCTGALCGSAKRGYPELIVLDTSNPDTFLRTEKAVKLARTLFIVSSKSGTTVETMSAYKYFWQKVYAAKGENA